MAKRISVLWLLKCSENLKIKIIKYLLGAKNFCMKNFTSTLRTYYEYFCRLVLESEVVHIICKSYGIINQLSFFN